MCDDTAARGIGHRPHKTRAMALLGLRPPTALETNFDLSQRLPVISDSFVSLGQQQPQPRLGEQMTLELQTEPSKYRANFNGHPGMVLGYQRTR